MEKQLITALLVIMLLAPQTGLEAKSRHHGVRDRDHDSEKHYYKARKHHKAKKHHKSKKHHHRAHKKHRHLRAIKAELKSLKQAVSEINTKMAVLKSQGAQIPAELVDKLNALQMAIDANQEAIGANQTAIGANKTDIDGVNIEIGNIFKEIVLINEDILALDKRITDLETAGPPGSGPPESDLVFSGNFIKGLEPRFGIKFDWAEFRRNATGLFTSIEISNNLSRGLKVVCDTPEVVQTIVDEFNSHIPIAGRVNNVFFTCMDPISGQDVNWNIGFCDGVELNAQLTEKPFSKFVCETRFSTGAAVRPHIGDGNWGGIAQQFGGGEDSVNLNPPTQTLKVILKR